MTRKADDALRQQNEEPSSQGDCAVLSFLHGAPLLVHTLGSEK